MYVCSICCQYIACSIAVFAHIEEDDDDDDDDGGTISVAPMLEPGFGSRAEDQSISRDDVSGGFHSVPLLSGNE
jgi:hypothetical protein